jgi:hypothetical protein
MELTETAKKYLSGLERVPAVTASKVEEVLRSAGQPCFDPWLEFQDQFGGYVERIGADVAVWGVVHARARWLGPFEADVELEKDGRTYYVACADVHPSYNYRLDNNGEFLGFPAEHFSVHVERVAAISTFLTGFRSESLSQAELRDPMLIETAGHAEEIASASDRYYRYLSTGDLLLTWEVDAPFPQGGWRRMA